MIDKTYGHLAHGTEESELERLAALDAKEAAERIVDAGEAGE